MISGKRVRKETKKKRKVTKPFRAPRRKSVIPGQLVQVNTERKVLFVGQIDGTNGTLACNGTGSIVCLNLIAVGSSMFNRIGRKVEMRSVRLEALISTLNVTRATIFPDILHISIVYDRQTNGANPAFADIYQDTEQDGTNTSINFSGINMNNRERFVSIMDKRIEIPQGTATAGVLTNVWPNGTGDSIRISEFRKLKGLTTHYGADSTPPVIGDIRTGALFITTRAGTAAGSELFQVDWNVRLKYTDV